MMAGEAGMGKFGALWVAALVFVGCSGGNQVTPTDPGKTVSPDLGPDAGPPSQPDSGPVIVLPQPDAGPPGTDAGTPGDAGTPDDAGTPGDAGTPPDGGTPTGSGFGGPGPWPMGNVTYGAADGIQESPVVGMSTDESQNLWVATNAALYLMTPGSTHFMRFDASAGLHLPGHDMAHCYDPGSNGRNPSGGHNGYLSPCPTSDADGPGISEIVGGGPNEVLVGYWGHEDFTLGNLPDGTPIDGTSSDPWRHTGKIDRVRLQANGTVEVVKFDVSSTNANEFWHNRTVQRMIYDHFKHPHELYVGFNHGVDKISPDLWAEPDPTQWFLTSEGAWMSDHLHPEVCQHATCTSEGSETLMLGDWRGLAIDAKGDLWVGGRFAAGRIRYTASNADWYNTPRADGPAINPGFGDGYNASLCGTGLSPVFCPPEEGDPVNISAATITPDGMIWWGSGTLFNDSRDVPYGMANWDGHHFNYFTLGSVGLNEANVRDLVALPDGRLVIAGINTGLVFWNPATGARVPMHAGQGIPSDRIYRLELDTMVDPPVLHVATAGGAASIRVFP
jgi:hypothetical protein